MAGVQAYNSPVPPNWQEMPKVTVVNLKHESVTFALLEKTGRTYYHLRYVFDRNGTGRPEPNHWVAQTPIDEVTLIEGHDKRLRDRALKYKADFQEHQNRLKEAFWKIDYETSEEKRQKQAQLEAEWREQNPPPAVPRIFKQNR